MRYHQLLLILFFLFSFSTNYSQIPEFSNKEIIQDLDSLKDLLEEGHYDLYAYTSKDSFDRNFRQVRNSISKDSLSLKEAVGIFQKVISKANTGHAEIDFPAQSYIDFVQKKGKVFPLEIALEDDRAYIRRNYSENREIRSGSEILEINGLGIKDILSLMYPHISAERPYLKNAKIEFWSFPRLYWQIFGEVEEFRVSVRDGDQVKDYRLQAVPALEAYEYIRKDILSADRKLRFYENIAYLNPGNFSGDEKEYQKFIDSAFTAIKEESSKDLIIDLRNNAGGNNSFSDYLISYFANRPFTWNSSFSIKTNKYLKQHTRRHSDTADAYFQEILRQPDGKVFPYHFEGMQPQSTEKRYKGEVFVLINRQTYSQAAVAAALIQDHQFATLAGEETGDFPSPYASIFTVALPNTGIPVKIPKAYIVRVNKSEKPEGVNPEISLNDHLLDEEDEILQGLLKKLQN